MTEQDKNRGELRRRMTEVKEVDSIAESRYVFGCQALMRELRSDGVPPGLSIHVLSGGNVDLISYVRWLLKCYGHLDELTICGWTISASNLVYVRQWREAGELGFVRIVVGDVYPARYKKEWEYLVGLRESGKVDQIVLGHLHCKILLARSGDACIVGEGSANCNCNPRVEQLVLTNDKGLYDFYDEFFVAGVLKNHLVGAKVL